MITNHESGKSASEPLNVSRLLREPSLRDNCAPSAVKQMLFDNGYYHVPSSELVRMTTRGNTYFSHESDVYELVLAPASKIFSLEKVKIEDLCNLPVAMRWGFSEQVQQIVSPSSGEIPA